MPQTVKASDAPGYSDGLSRVVTLPPSSRFPNRTPPGSWQSGSNDSTQRMKCDPAVESLNSERNYASVLGICKLKNFGGYYGKQG
jgi:hypothetical protein